MKKRFLLLYQILTGLSDTLTGCLLVAAPAFTLRLMGLHIPEASHIFLSYIGVFVGSVGLACLYGGLLLARTVFVEKLEVVWLVTAISRGLVALFVIAHIASGRLDPGWLIVAISDGLLATFQSVGLATGWLRREA